MLEPHVFCGPEFVLEVPKAHVDAVLMPHTATAPSAPPPTSRDGEAAGGGSGAAAATAASAGWTVRPESLLQFQTDLYGVCTPGLRRRLHRPVLTSSQGAQAMREDNVKEVATMLMYTAADAPGHTRGGVVGGGGSAPAAPGELCFLTAKATNTLSREEEASLAQTLKVIQQTAVSAASTTSAAAAASPPASSPSSVFVTIAVTDSRVAGELYMLCLRNTSVALSHSCRLYNYYRATARAAAIDPAEILKRKESQRGQFNLDSDLWSALELAVTPDLVEEVVSRKKKADAESNRYPPGRILTAREEHQQRVEAVLLYCETRVSYAGVLDTKEEASPLLIAMGLFFRLRLTLMDLYTHFVRHPRRAIRAMALLIARYTVAPEELAPFFYPSMHDGVVIATTEDAQLTCPMSTFASTALTKDEVSEAWLPVYHPFFMESVVSAAMEGMEWLWRKQLEARELRRSGGADSDGQEASRPGTDGARHEAGEEEEEDGVPLTRARARATSTAAGPGGEPAMSDEVKGSGRGVAALGFLSLRELNDFAKQQERALVPQRMTTLLASRYSRRRERDDALTMLHEGNEEGERSDAEEDDRYGGSDAASRSSEEEFLIHVDVAGGGGDGGRDGGVAPPSASSLAARSSRKREQRDSKEERGPEQGGDALPHKTRRKEARLDPHDAILKEGYRVVLSLLGRRQPFDRHEARYLEF